MDPRLLIRSAAPCPRSARFRLGERPRFRDGSPAPARAVSQRRSPPRHRGGWPTRWRPGLRAGGACAPALLGAVALTAALLGLAPPAGAAEAVELRVVAVLLSDEPGSIDPAARQLHEALKRQRMEFRSARVVTSKTLRLAVGATGHVPLPGGRSLRVQPLDAGEGGVLLAVRVEGSVDLDARVPPGRPLVVRAGRVEGAELVVSVEPTR